MWGCISFAFIMGEYVFGPIGLITLVPALIGVAIYEIFSLIVLGLKKAIKQNSVDKITFPHRQDHVAGKNTDTANAA